jgi:hypothetical protein
MHDLCMATKTISLELDAYEKLRRAKSQARESFSSVVRRARWDDLPPTAGQLLEQLRTCVREHPEMLLAPETLDWLDQKKRTSRRRTRH